MKVGKKINISFLGIMLMLILVFIIGCGNKNSLDGVWVNDEYLSKIEFSGDNIIFSGMGFTNQGKYIISGNVIEVSYSNGIENIPFARDGNTITFGYDSTQFYKINNKKNRSTVNDLAGIWQLDRIESSTGDVVKRFEFFKDGSGSMEGVSVTWKTENNRIMVTASNQAQSFEYLLSGLYLAIFDRNINYCVIYKKVEY